MIVSHAQRFIFFHNPKCAGTSFRNALQPYHDDKTTFWGPAYAPYFCNYIDHTHLRLWELAALFPKLFDAAGRDYRSVVFVRNPYARFLSAVAEHFKKFERHFHLEELSILEQQAVVTKFIERTLNVREVVADWTYIHFSPQIWFIMLGDRVIPRRIVPMDPEGTFMNRAIAYLNIPTVSLPHHNRSPLDLGHLLAVPRIVSFIQDFYAMDFEFLLALPELAALTSLPTRPSDR